jgi:hypothetical protein
MTYSQAVVVETSFRIKGVSTSIMDKTGNVVGYKEYPT